MLTELRSLFKRIALNSLWLLIARVFSQGLMIVFTVLVARYLGEVGLGQYAFIAAVVFLGNVLTTFGLDTLLIREVARTRSAPSTTLPFDGDQDRRRGSGGVLSLSKGQGSGRRAAPLVTATLWIQLGFSALLIGGIAVGAGWLPNKTPETVLGLRLYSLSLIPLAFNTAFSASLRAYERMDLILVLNLLSAVVQTGGALGLLQTGRGLVALVVFLLAVQTLTAVVAGGMCFRWLPGFVLTRRVPRRLVRRMLHQSYPLALVAVLMVAYQRLGVLMLSSLADDAATGWFAAAARITDALKMVHYAYFGAVFPLMSRLAVDSPLPGDSQDARNIERGLYRTSFGLLLGFGLLTALAVTPLAQPVIRLLYGLSYAPSVPALQILVWTLIPFAVSSHVFFWLISNGREKATLKVIALTLGSTAVLNVLLIPAFGLVGACLAALAGEVLQAVLYMPYAWRGISDFRFQLSDFEFTERDGL
ncbi:MAG: flippase [Anaerolineae bacterium]